MKNFDIKNFLRKLDECSETKNHSSSLHCTDETKLKKITKVLSDPETIKKFKELYPNVIDVHDGRLHFNMSLTHNENAWDHMEMTTYNNHIINLFFDDPDFHAGFTKYQGKCPVTTSCWKGNMVIYCLSKVLCGLTGYGTRDIIARTLGYNNIGNLYELSL